MRDRNDDPALFDRADVAPGPGSERGTGRAGLSEPGPGPVLGGEGGDAVAVEIRARSIVNRVPGEAAVPFRWTVNPYRGCSHACVYCLSGDTPILMADGRTAPLAGIRVGDRIYGTRSAGDHRRYTPTTVLAHWTTEKRAYRITLADGTVLVASGDHRFLTVHGWKHVTGAVSGHRRRPHLAEGAGLLGPGGSADAPGDLDGVALNPDTPLGVVSIEDTGEVRTLYDITTGTGDFLANGVVSHNCFARRTHEYLDLDSGHDFDSTIMVKVNAGELLRRELANPRWSGEPIAMGTNTDPYQRAEGRYRLMPEIIAALRDFANPFSVLTKGRLILRDLDLLEQASRVTDVGLAVSVGSLDDRVWRSVEPGTPRPASRLDVVRRCADRGLNCSVLMAPILPGLTDSAERIEATVAAIAESGATSLTPIVLHLRPGAREWYLQWLAREYPHLVPTYRELYGRGAYAPRDYRDLIGARVRDAARRHGLAQPPGDGGSGGGTRHRPAAPEDPPAGRSGPPSGYGEQLPLLGT
ncbi:Rv2578c family radical SAM protein [Streptomonospora salina]